MKATKLERKGLTIITALSIMFYVMGLESMVTDHLMDVLVFWSALNAVLIILCISTNALKAFDEDDTRRRD